jgi:hypothetical protein
MKTFDATVRIDDAPAGKRFPFQGAWLVDDDGQRWLAADSPEPWLEPFADRRVRVIGQREQPPEAPDKAPRVRIESLRLATEQPDPSASLVEVKAERSGSRAPSSRAKPRPCSSATRAGSSGSRTPSSPDPSPAHP